MLLLQVSCNKQSSGNTIITVVFLRCTIRGMFADACSFESSRVKSARMHAFREKFASFIYIRFRITTTKYL